MLLGYRQRAGETAIVMALKGASVPTRRLAAATSFD
jgi:hypothetical protein